MTTELGRQPWVVYRLLRVEDAVTQGSGVWVSLAALIVGYTVMTVMAVATLRSMARRWRAGEPLDLPTPYSPTTGAAARAAAAMTLAADSWPRSSSSGWSRTRCSRAPTSAAACGTSPRATPSRVGRCAR